MMEAPPVIQTPRTPRMAWWWLGALPLIACGIVLFLFNPSQYSFYPRCALYTMTGIYCPGCGSTRALYQLVHGHLLTALHYNLLLILSLPFVGYYSWRCARNWAAGETLPPLPLSGRWLKFLVAVIIIFTILRNIPCAPFTWLAPPSGS
jgi:Protein of unknown function (DUF2752)